MYNERTRIGRDAFELILGVSVLFVAPFLLSGGTVWQIFAAAIFIGMIASPFAGAWFIRTVVRRINHRDDRRHQLLPPNDP